MSLLSIRILCAIQRISQFYFHFSIKSYILDLQFNIQCKSLRRRSEWWWRKFELVRFFWTFFPACNAIWGCNFAEAVQWLKGRFWAHYATRWWSECSLKIYVPNPGNLHHSVETPFCFCFITRFSKKKKDVHWQKKWWNASIHGNTERNVVR